MDINLAAQNLQGEQEIDRSNDWTVFEAADGSKCLNTGVSIFQLLDSNDYAALRMLSESARKADKQTPLLLYPYKNAESGVVVEPGREYLSGSMPYITEIMARIAANEAWHPPLQTPETTVKQQMASARAQFDLKSGADERAVLAALEKQFAEIELEEEKKRAEDDEDDEISFGAMREQIDGKATALKSSQRTHSESSTSGAASSDESSATSEQEQSDGFDRDARGNQFDKPAQDTFGGAVGNVDQDDDDEQIDLPGTRKGASLLQGVDGGEHDQTEQQQPAASLLAQPQLPSTTATTSAAGFAGSYGRLAQPVASFGIPLRDLQADGENDDDSDFDSEERREAARQEAQHAASMPDFLALMQKSDAIDRDPTVPVAPSGSFAQQVEASHVDADCVGYFDENKNFIDQDGGRTTPDGSYYTADGTFAGMVDETGGFYDARDGSYTDADGNRYSEKEFEGGSETADADDFEVFNGQKLPVIAASERKKTDLVGLTTREARRAQKERQEQESEIASTRRTITQVSEEYNGRGNKKPRTLGDELKEFNLPSDIMQQFAEQGALDKPIGDGAGVANYEDIAHLGQRLLAPKQKDVQQKKQTEANKSVNSENENLRKVDDSAESHAKDERPQPPLQPLKPTALSTPQSRENTDKARSFSSKTAFLDLARASAAQMEASAAQWRAMANLFESIV